MRGIVWFRRDLRIADQPALTAACEACSEVIPLFVFDEPLLQAQVFGSASLNFMLGCLDELASALAGSGLALQWRRGKPVEEVVRAVRDWNANIVYWNRDYEPAALERDRAVQQQLAQLGVVVRTFKDHVVFEAEEVRGATGAPPATLQCLSRALVDEVAGRGTSGASGTQEAERGTLGIPGGFLRSSLCARVGICTGGSLDPTG
jgi:deoxyribodipyrimidine photo-lyase